MLRWWWWAQNWIFSAIWKYLKWNRCLHRSFAQQGKAGSRRTPCRISSLSSLWGLWGSQLWEPSRDWGKPQSKCYLDRSTRFVSRLARCRCVCVNRQASLFTPFWHFWRSKFINFIKTLIWFKFASWRKEAFINCSIRDQTEVTALVHSKHNAKLWKLQLWRDVYL